MGSVRSDSHFEDYLEPILEKGESKYDICREGNITEEEFDSLRIQISDK